MADKIKCKLHLPYDCLFDLRWGFIRLYSGLSEMELAMRFNAYCSRISDDLTLIFPLLTKPFEINKKVVVASPRTAILSVVNLMFRQFASEFPGKLVTLHITVDFSEVPFIPKDIRSNIADAIRISMGGGIDRVYATPVCKGYEGYSIRDLRRSFDGMIIYDIDRFMQFYGVGNRMRYDGIGIATRPLFKDKHTPEMFHDLINSADKRSLLTGTIMEPGDHYDVLSNICQHYGSVFFHSPEKFSAILPK